MNTVSIIVSILVPLIVAGYIIGDLLSKRTTRIHQSNGSKIDDIIYDYAGNEGERLYRNEIIENTSYCLNNYADILLK